MHQRLWNRRGEARFGAAVLGAGDGVRGNDRRAGQRLGQRADDIGLARADIADDRIGRQVGGDLRRDRAHRADGNAQDDEIGIDDRRARGVGDIVEQLKPVRDRANLRVRVVSGQTHGRHVRPDRARDRRADQADSDDRDAGKGQHAGPHGGWLGRRQAGAAPRLCVGWARSGGGLMRGSSTLAQALASARRMNLAAAGEPMPRPGADGQTRRAVLKALGATGLAAALPRPARAAPITGPVAIIGGGIAGLTALWQLTEAGIDARVYEARPRLGGRMFTHRPGNGGVTMEVGGQLVNSDHADMHRLAKAFGAGADRPQER